MTMPGPRPGPNGERRTAHAARPWTVTLLLVAAVACGRAHGDPPHAPAQAPQPARVPATTPVQATQPAPVPGTTPDATSLASLLSLPGSTSTSIGGPNDGRVVGAVALPMLGESFRFGPARDPSARFGTVEMVQALVRASDTVAARLPGSQLTIHDLGLERGGVIPHHGSHRAGRDVDVLFYLLDVTGQPRPGVGVPIEPNGTGVDYRDLTRADDDVPVRLDVPRTWAFVEALIADETAGLQRIFVVEHVRTMLLDYARSAGADPARVRLFEDTTCQPSYPHDDHLHLRFYCTAEDIGAGCADSAPIYPWHRSRLRRVGVTPVAQVLRPDRPRAALTTEAEARASAPENMHVDVVEFLARRETWRAQPHPGRRYCR